MNDRLLQLAFAIYHNPGVYALLLGSGISRPAEIPTGAQIIDDLIRKIAEILGEEITGDPERWYANRFQKSAGYDTILEQLGQTRLDRAAILRDYIAPTDEDIQQGRRVPTKAHKAIAWLMKHEYIKVIVTTNFDRLMERALSELGVDPELVITEETLDGLERLQHSRSTIVKVHGDYHGRTRNIGDELNNYPKAMNDVLDRIFSEFGLIICGWSSESDGALRKAIEGIEQEQYGMYWVAYDPPKVDAQKLIEARKAFQYDGWSADDFFGGLKKMVESLESLSSRQVALTASMVAEQTRKYLNQDNRIDLEEMLRKETDRAYRGFTSTEFLSVLSEAQKDFNDVWKVYFRETEAALNILINIGWYGEEIYARYFEYVISSWLEQPKDPQLKDFVARHFPALLAVYCAGIAAFHNENNWRFLPAILINSRTVDQYTQTRTPSLVELFAKTLELYQRFNNYRTNGNYLYGILRPVFKNLIPSDTDYNHTFDLFEMLVALVYLQLVPNRDWMPPHVTYLTNRSWAYIEDFWRTGGQQLPNWGLLSHYMFKNSPVRLAELLEKYCEIANIYRRGQKLYGLEIPDFASAFHGGRDLTRLIPR